MKIITTIIILISCSLLVCSQNLDIKRDIIPIESLDVEILKKKCGLKRSINCDVSIEFISEKQWKMLLDYDIFFKTKNKTSGYRLPKIPFFQIIVSNIGKNPVEIRDVLLKYGETETKALSIKAIKKRLKSPIYSILNFNIILSNRRLLDNIKCINKIDFLNDTIDYRFNFINPTDKVLKIVAFDWIPVHYRTFQIIVKLKLLDKEKTFNFKFKRIEHRLREKIFKKTS